MYGRHIVRMACHNGVLIWVQYNVINKSARTPLSLAKESLNFKGLEVNQKGLYKKTLNLMSNHLQSSFLNIFFANRSIRKPQRKLE